MSDPVPVDLLQIPASGTVIIDIDENLIPAGSPLCLKSLGTDISSGFVVVTLLS